MSGDLSIEEEAQRALDALQAHACPDEEEGALSHVERFSAALTGFSDDELEAAKEPHPHAFQDGERGLFPVREVTVIGAPGREGKTRATFALAVSYVLGTRVVGLQPQADRSVLIYSAEDSRDQYARLMVAHCSRLGREDVAKVRSGIVVPDLQADGMGMFQTIVAIADRQPVESLAVDAVIDALLNETSRRRDHSERPVDGTIECHAGVTLPPGLLIFETASTLSEAEEDNRAFRIMVRALRRIAREADVAVVVIHHTSQAASNNLPELNITTADLRGATALVYKARQVHLLVNLGSDEDPYPDNDARTVMRRMAAPHATGRVTALVCLDSSKSMDPPPVLFHWHATPYGPALSTAPVPPNLDGMRWRKLHQMIRAQRAEHRDARKDEARDAKVARVVAVVGQLVAQGKQPTVKAVSVAAGHGADWAAPYLSMAVGAGDLMCHDEHVPRTKGNRPVYRPADWSEAAA